MLICIPIISENYGLEGVPKLKPPGTLIAEVGRGISLVLEKIGEEIGLIQNIRVKFYQSRWGTDLQVHISVQLQGFGTSFETATEIYGYTTPRAVNIAACLTAALRGEIGKHKK